MKYLIINGSPHKGNTWKLVEIAKEHIGKVNPQSMFEEVHLMQIGLPFCLGCSNCFRLGGDKCPHYNFMEPLIEKIQEADGLIIASTTFNLRETALLKNFLDHLNYMLHRPRFFKKKALIVTTVGGVGGGKTVKSIAATLRGMGFNRCYGIAIRSVSWNAYQPNESAIQKVTKTSEKFCKDVSSGKLHYQKSDVLIPYNLFRGMCVYYAPGTEYPTQDGIYYSENSKRAYNPVVPLHLYQKWFGGMFRIIGKKAGKGAMVTYKK